MPTYRLPASAGPVRGDLTISPRGLSFTPRTGRDGRQLVLALDGWQLGWDDVAGIERVDAHGGIRVHYDGAARFIALRVQAHSRELFAIVDEQLARATADGGVAAVAAA